jgi:hypothetical protein
VIKSGDCQVIKKVIVKKNLIIKRNKASLYKTIEEIFDSITIDDTVLSKSSNISRDEEQTLYLKIEELNKGDVYGIRDVVFKDSKNPTMLISFGVECILLNRKFFKKALSKSNEIKLQIFLMPYPNEKDLVESYYEFENWKRFKKENFVKCIRKEDK